MARRTPPRSQDVTPIAAAALQARPLTPGDFRRLADWLDAEGLPSGDLREPDVRLFAFRDGDAAVGYAGLESTERTRCCVRSSSIRRGAAPGLGRAIVEATLAEAHRLGAMRAFLLTIAAKDLFRTARFRVDRSRVGAGRFCNPPSRRPLSVVGAADDQVARLNTMRECNNDVRRPPPVVSRSLSHRLDLRRDGVGGGDRLFRARREAGRQFVPGRNHQYSDRHRPHPDDVSAVRQGALRGAARRLRRRQSARPVAGPELAHRAGPDVRAGDRLPARQAGIHGRPDPDRPGALHRDGGRVERPRQGLDRIRRRPRRLQLDLPGAVLQRLRLVLRHRAAAAVRAHRLRRRHLDRPDRQERVHLPRRSLRRRVADPRGHAAVRVARHGTTAASCRSSARSRWRRCCSPSW